MPKTTLNSDLLDEALILCQTEFEDKANAALQSRIQLWQGQSSQHKIAWEHAKQLWQASGEQEACASISTPSMTQSLVCWLEVQYERLLDVASSRSTPMFAQATAAAFFLFVVALVFTLQEGKQPPQDHRPTVSQLTPKEAYKTKWKQQKDITLSDGSRVTLNWNTQLDVHFTAQKRTVVLHKGEALFKIAKDASRPFTVEAKGLKATALGTEFTVRYQSDAGAGSEVTVQEGTVAINTPSIAPILLVKDQSISVRENGLSDIATINANLSSAWRDGMIVFKAKALIDVIRELDRYIVQDINIGLLYEQQQIVTATYFTQRADDALGLLATAFHLKIEQVGNNTLKVSSLPPPRPQ